MVALVAAGCGARHESPRRAAVERYFAAVNAVTRGLRVPVAATQLTFMNYRTGRKLLAHRAELVADARRLRALPRRLAQLDPPPAARPVATDVVGIARQEDAALDDLAVLADFLPRLERQQAAIFAAQTRLHQGLVRPRSVREQVRTLDRYVADCDRALAFTRALRAPAAFAPWLDATTRHIVAARDTSTRLARILRERPLRRSRLAAAIAAFETVERTPVVDARSAILRARTAYLRHLRRIVALRLRLAHDELRLEKSLS